MKRAPSTIEKKAEGGPQNQSEGFGEEENLLLLPGIET